MSDEGQIWRFGAFELNPGSRQLLKNGVRLKIQEQPFQVLSALVQRRGEVVGRDELRRRVWSDETFVDYDNGLNVSIAKLRQALGDNSDNPAYIETLPRIGYRFIARVEVLPPGRTRRNPADDIRLMVFGLAFAAAVAGMARGCRSRASSGAGGRRSRFALPWP
ncbi:MAG: transcriptional regulator [Bryobacteraceae bacterium]